ncbi:MAG: hypothetical protein EZS28_036550, partial [Streblomastix strix]
MGWPFFKNDKEFNKTGTVRAGTVREFRHIKVHCKDTRRDRSRATGDGVEIGKFLQAELQPTLQDIERQLTPRQAASEKTQVLITKVLEAMTGIQARETDFWATNIQDKQNGEARRREIQCPSLLPVTSVPVPDEVLDAKRSPIEFFVLFEKWP